MALALGRVRGVLRRVVLCCVVSCRVVLEGLWLALAGSGWLRVVACERGFSE